MKIEWLLDFPVHPSLLSLMQLAADRALLAEGVPLACGMSVRICDDAAIRVLNASTRGIDAATDVLSFPTVRWPSGITAGTRPDLLRKEYDDDLNVCYLGDSVISIEHVQTQAREYGHSEQREAAYLLVHSICHLMGYDHMKEEEKSVMRNKEEEILSSIGLSRDGESTAQDCSDEIPQENKPMSVVSDEVLLDLAKEAMTRSYSPYSHYPVGAALHATDGRIFLGCNIENASFGATICAERTAAVKAISEGARKFDIIAIATRDTAGWPCGICRQFLSEFAPDIRVLVTWTDSDGVHVEKSSLQQILPHQFELKDSKS